MARVSKNVDIREAWLTQLPVVAALLAAAEDDPDFRDVAHDAVELLSALEDELEG